MPAGRGGRRPSVATCASSPRRSAASSGEYTSEPGAAQLEARLAEVCRRAAPSRTPVPALMGAGMPALMGAGAADAPPPAVRRGVDTERKRLGGGSKNDPPPIDLRRAREVLDAAQAGLDDAKDLIIEYLAVRRRNAGGGGAVLCLLGPPAVGKTSLAQAVASALGPAMDQLRSAGGGRMTAGVGASPPHVPSHEDGPDPVPLLVTLSDGPGRRRFVVGLRKLLFCCCLSVRLWPGGYPCGPLALIRNRRPSAPLGAQPPPGSLRPLPEAAPFYGADSRRPHDPGRPSPAAAENHAARAATPALDGPGLRH